ncbi:MAG TPA: PaaI family thioesterase [Candidatus Dormibacteraeota bacterium]|nr:PaaI family thioesterase [Candidatus Dormibacteraeota bacterium]
MQDRIQRMLDGHESRSPAWRWLGIKLVEAEAGRTLLEMKVTEEMRNHGGVCHGGFLGTLADSAMGSAMATVLPEGERHLSFDLKLSFMRPVEIGATVRCTGTVIHSGRRTGVCESRLEVGGELVGTGSASFIVYLPENT